MSATDFQLGTLGSEARLSANEADVQDFIENIANESRLAGGNLVRYKVAQMRHWIWIYRHIYGKSTYIFDGGMGRNDLYALYQADAEMSFLMPQDQGVQLAYTVRFSRNSWRENIIQRVGDMWAWQLSFELVQVR